MRPKGLNGRLGIMHSTLKLLEELKLISTGPVMDLRKSTMLKDSINTFEINVLYIDTCDQNYT